MKRSITVAIAILAVATSSVVALAQQGGAGDHDQKSQHAQKRAIERGEFRRHLRHRVAEKLNLSAEQKQRLKILRDQTKASLDALNDQPGTRESKREKYRAIRQNAHEQFLGILDKEQKAKLEAMKKGFKARHHGDKSGRVLS